MLMVVSMHASGSQWRVAGRDWQASHRCCCHWYWRVFLGTSLCAHSFEVSLLCHQAHVPARPGAVHKIYKYFAHVTYCGQALLTVCFKNNNSAISNAWSCCYVQADVTRARHRPAVLGTNENHHSLGRFHCLT